MNRFFVNTMIRPATLHLQGRLFRSVGLAAALAFSAASCERIGERMEITEVREISKHAVLPKSDASSAQRFYDTKPEAPPAGENPLTWITPEGWTVAPSGAAGGMRLIDLRFGSGGEGECFLSIMPGQAGGLEANVNRWRAQMGLPAYTPEELAALPKKTFVGREATFVAFDGDFKNVGQETVSAGYRMLGLVQEAPEFTLFVKMTGPKDLVLKNEAAFDLFSQSISLKR